MATVTLTALQVKFRVEDKLVIGDPCYFTKKRFKSLDEIVDADPEIVILDDAAGQWIATCETIDEGESCGARVSKLVISKLNKTLSETMLARGKLTPEQASEAIRNEHRPVALVGPVKELEVVGVDSGQMAAICATQVPVDYDALLEKHHEYCIDHGAFMIQYTEGAVSQTGFGDGCYTVYVQNGEDDKPARVTVVFIERD